MRAQILEVLQAECIANELEKELETRRGELAELTAENEELSKKQAEIDAVLSQYTQSEIEEARALLDEYNTVKEREKNLKASSKAQLTSLINEIQSLEEMSEEA
ncbi:hypothetical protein OESDEN_18759, partial [Oesophagostomum dentatum]